MGMVGQNACLWWSPPVRVPSAFQLPVPHPCLILHKALVCVKMGPHTQYCAHIPVGFEVLFSPLSAAMEHCSIDCRGSAPLSLPSVLALPPFRIPLFLVFSLWSASARCLWSLPPSSPPFFRPHLSSTCTATVSVSIHNLCTDVCMMCVHAVNVCPNREHAQLLPLLWHLLPPPAEVLAPLLPIHFCNAAPAEAHASQFRRILHIALSSPHGHSVDPKPPILFEPLFIFTLSTRGVAQSSLCTFMYRLCGHGQQVTAEALQRQFGLQPDIRVHVFGPPPC